MAVNKMLQKDNMWFYVMLSGSFYWLAQSLTRPIIALYAQSLGINEAKIGFIVGIFAVLPFLIAIPSGGIADSIGRIKVLHIGAVLMFISGIIYMFAANIYLLMLAQVIAGVGQMTVWLIIQVLVTSEKKNQAQRIATFSVYNSGGQMIGPLIGGFLAEQYNITMSFFVYTVVSFLLILIVYQLKDESHKPVQEELNIRQMYTNGLHLLRNGGFIATLLCTFIALFIVDVRMTFLPIYLKELNISPFRIGILISIGAFSALLIKPIYASLIDKLGYKVLLVVTFALSLSLLFLTPALTHFYSFVVLLLISGVALGINQPLSLSLISESTDRNERGIAIGLRLMANRLSQLLDPILFGMLTVIIGLKITFLIIGFILLGLSIVTVLLLNLEKINKKSSSLKEKAPKTIKKKIRAGFEDEKYKG
jgi:MFS family permease